MNKTNNNIGWPYSCTRTGVHDKAVLHNEYGHRKNKIG
jgi:hypothetical protein